MSEIITLPPAETALQVFSAPAAQSVANADGRFTKNPVTIDAIKWTGSNLREVIAFTDGPPDTRSIHAGMAWEAYVDLVARDGLKIYTLEGKMLANIGDWIIRGIKGEYYPCKPDIFEATYTSAPQAQAVERDALTPAAPAITLLAGDHSGMKVDYRGLFKQVQRAIKRSDPGYAEMLRQLEDHLQELGQRWYAGDTNVVDEILQLYCIERDARKTVGAAATAAPQAQADARDAEQERWMEIGKAIERACIDLPDSTEIVISLERDAGTVTMFDPDGNEHDQFSHEDGFAGVVNAAIEAARAAAKEQG